MIIQWIATTDQSIPGCGGAITESSTDQARTQITLGRCIMKDVRIAQGDTPQAHHVRPLLANIVLSHMREILLKVAVSCPDKHHVIWSVIP